MLLLALAGVFGFIVLVMWAVSSQLEERAAVRASLEQIGDYEVETVRQADLNLPFAQRIARPTLEWITGLGRRLTPVGYRDQSAEKLIHAGKARAEDLDRFLAIRVITVALVPVAFIVFFRVLDMSGRLPLTMFLFTALALILGPDAQLNRQVEERRYAIQVQLPDVLDLLTISVEAGLGFEQALDRTVAALPGALSIEFSRMIGEVRAGASRSEAMRAFEHRTGVPEVKSFVLAILQADTFGVSIGRTLRSQADEMRVRRRQLAQERAQKAPVKMLFPMVFCIFPALFVVVLGPAVLSVTDALSDL